MTVTAVVALVIFALNIEGLDPVLLTVSIMVAATPLLLAALGEMMVERPGC